MIRSAAIVSANTDPEVYHAQAVKRGAPEYPMSPSAIREFARCPQRWVNGYESPDTDARLFGSLVDCRLLTPEQFKARYAIKPATYLDAKTKEKKPWNGNATICRTWLEEQAGRQIISVGDLQECDAAIRSLRQDESISEWLGACDFQVLLAGEYLAANGIVIPVRCLLDFVPRNDTEFAKCLGDLKTTRNAAPMTWQRWCYQAGYHLQAAFDTDLYVAATGEDRNTWCFLLVENFKPWQIGKRLLSQDFMELGRGEYRQHLENYAACLKLDRWPGYDDSDEAVDGWSIVSPEPWMANQAQFAPRLNFDEPRKEPEETNDVPH